MDISIANVIKGRAPLRASQSLRAAMRMRGKGPGTLNFFHSPKTSRDFVLPSDLEYMHALTLEADEDVATYDLDPTESLRWLMAKVMSGQNPMLSLPATPVR